MIKLLLCGADGTMGRVIRETIEVGSGFVIAAAFDNHFFEASFPVFTDLSQCNIDVDVIVDFSHYSAFDQILKFAVSTKKPLVAATTGLSDVQSANIAEASQMIPIFKTANMSLGVNVLAEALKQIASALNDFDIEIIEKHHNKKKDAPSGTALLLAEAIKAGLTEEKTTVFGREGRNCQRQKDEIGIHAVRGGTIPGEHSILFAGDDELIEIKHTALSKKVFANGALKAAAFLAHQPAGLYDMNCIVSQ